jgi:CheY-like chemotaxis protein
MGTVFEDYEIWVIDDEQQVLSSTRTFLEVLGYKVQTFSDPALAEIEIATCKKYVLLIVDHDFSQSEDPNYKGYEFSRFVKENYFLKRSAPIIYLTGRERKSNFDAQKASFPNIVPNVFLSKSEVALDAGLLENSVAAGFVYLEEIENSIDEHGLEIALSIAEDWRY